jgi:ATP-binding cassette, subfamily B, bacterial MsbA
LRRLLHYVRPYWLVLGASVVSMAVVGLLDAFRILLIYPILKTVLDPSAPPNQPLVLFKINIHVPAIHFTLYLNQVVPPGFHNPWSMVAFALIVSTLIKGLLDYAGTYLVNYSGFGAITDLRNDLYRAILRRSVGFFQKYTTGTLLSTIINDIEKIQYTLSTILAEFLQQVFILIFTAIVVIYSGKKLAWVLLLFIPLIFSSARRIGHRVRKTTRTGQDKLADIHNILHETITGVRIVKAFGMELWENMRFRGAAKKLFRANLKSVAAAAISSPLMDLLGAIAIALLLWFGRNMINKHLFDEGTFFVFIVAVFRLYDPIRKFAIYNNSFQQAIGASSSIFAFMDAEDDVREKPAAMELPPFHDSVRFDHISFGYAESEGASTVLSDVDLDVHRGEVLAIVGSSGAGKSTLVHLIPRFFDVTSGRILIDGHDVRDVTLVSLRAQIGIVTQDTILFNDTVRNNIAYGRGKVTQEEVEHAAKAALAHDFITAMPDGYDTMIGERGLRLSGGERQRIAIARALLKNAPILILDEATSALDTESERLVQSALQNLMTGRTVFVIAHRLSTVRRADRIVVLEGGTISDIGSHEDLMSRLGTYRRLYDMQFVDGDTPVASKATQ